MCLCRCSRRNSRPSSARPAPPQIKKQENHPEGAPPERRVLRFSLLLLLVVLFLLVWLWFLFTDSSLFWFCRGSSAKTSVPIILDGKRLSEDDDDSEPKALVVEETVPLPPGVPSLNSVTVASFQYQYPNSGCRTRLNRWCFATVFGTRPQQRRAAR